LRPCLGAHGNDFIRYFVDRNPKLFQYVLDHLRGVELRYSGDYPVLEEEFAFYRVRFFYSKILKREHKAQIFQWLEKKDVSFNLLFSATRDGFGAAGFHSKCDNKGPTLVVVKSESGHIFGGYASQSWQAIGAYIGADGSFLFTLTNGHNIPPTKYTIIPSNANNLYGHPGYGPTFGSGHDLHIAADANANTNSYSNLPHGYADSTGKGNNTFTGGRNFKVLDYEVFQVK